MAMSRKNYIAAAEILNSAKAHGLVEGNAHRELVSMFARYFKSDNSAFSFDRFETAAGVTEEPKWETAGVIRGTGEIVATWHGIERPSFDNGATLAEVMVSDEEDEILHDCN